MTGSPFSDMLQCEDCGIIIPVCSSHTFMFSKAWWCFFPKKKYTKHIKLQRQLIFDSSDQL